MVKVLLSYTSDESPFPQEDDVPYRQRYQPVVFVQSIVRPFHYSIPKYSVSNPESYNLEGGILHFHIKRPT